MLPRDLKSVRVAELGSVFGTEFADALQGIEVDTWNGPVRSGFGIHLVKIDNRIESQMPSFDEVSELVQREWLVVQRTKTIDGMYERMAEKYSIVIEASPAILPDAIGEAAP